VVGAAVAIEVKCSSFVPIMALGGIDCYLLGEVCSRLFLAVGAFVGLMDEFLLFLPVAESLVSGNDCIDASFSILGVSKGCGHQ